MSWYCDRCDREQKDGILGGIISNGDLKYTIKNFYSMKERNFPSYEKLCYKCHSYLFDSCYGYSSTRMAEDRKKIEGEDNGGTSSRFNKKCYNFDVEHDLISKRTKLYWDEDYDSVISDANESWNDTAFAYEKEFAPECLTCSRCGRTIREGKRIYTSRVCDYLSEHDVDEDDDVCSSCNDYLCDDSSESSRKTIDEEFLDDNSKGLSSRFNEKCKEFDEQYNFVNPKNGCFYDEDGFYDEYVEFDANANQTICEKLKQKSTTALYESLKESVINSYETTFSTNLQNYVVRLGLIISDVAYKKFSGKNHYFQILDYICHDVLNDDDIYKKMIKINDYANNVKHSTKNVNIDIYRCLIPFNTMIDKLIEISDCNSFEICHVYQPRKFEKREIECNCCGRMEPEKYYRCKNCGKIVCDECYNREIKMCSDCIKHE